MGLDDPAGNRQTDAGSAARAIPRLVGAVEPLEDECLVGERETGTIVTDLNTGFVRLGPESEPDDGPARGVRQRVADEVVEHLRQPPGVANGRMPIGCGELEPHASGRRRKSVTFGGLLEQAAQVDRGTFQVLRSELGAGAKVVNQAFKPMQLSQQPIDRRGVGLDDLVTNAFDMPTQHGEGRAKLMRHVIDEPIALSFRRLEIRAELFEGRPQLVELADARRGEVELSLTGGHAAGCPR